MVKVIQAMSIESGYTLVVERTAILHAAAPLDITDKVLERLDKANVQVKFEFPPKAEPGEPPPAKPEAAPTKPGAADKPATPPRKTN